MMRNTKLLLTVVVGSAVLMAACSVQTRYRVMSFLFDGVPEPGAAEEALQAAAAAPQGPQESPYAIRKRSGVKRPVSFHPPYESGRCDGCHDAFSGRLIKPLDKGLCTMCHNDPPGQDVFLHGPVARNACTFCHEPHSSIYMHLLKDDVPGICFQCHLPDDLRMGIHHAAIEDQPCTDCHDPHGGDNPFFLKRPQP